MSSPLLIVAQIALLAPPRPDPSTLTPPQRQTFQSVASEEFCSCNSALTLSGCLELRPKCYTANHLGRIVLLTSQAGLGTDEILGYISDRVMGPFCSTAKTFNLEGAPTIGSSASAVTVVEFADFRCGHCKRAAPVVHQTIERLGRKKVRYIFSPFPLSNHPEGVLAAEAALAAQAQGKFWPMHDGLFEGQDNGFTIETVTKIAKKAGLDMKRFTKDITAHTYRDKVMALKQQGLDAGIDGTPAFFVNGLPYELDTTLFTLNDRIEMELDRNRGTCQ